MCFLEHTSQKWADKLYLVNQHILIPSKINGIEKYCILFAKLFPEC